MSADGRRRQHTRARDAHLERSDEHLMESLFGRTTGQSDDGYGTPRKSLAERLQDRLDERFNRQPLPEASDDYRWPPEPSRPADIAEASTRELVERRFPCESCGAVLHYEIGTEHLRCTYCGHDNDIDVQLEVLRELDLRDALRQLEQAPPVSPDNKVISCPNCAAEFALDAHIHAGECPFCGTHVVTDTGEYRPIKPKGILPFAVTAEAARESYKRWLKGLWFAPSELKKYARDDTSLNGVYIPYWTYDSDTATAYQGQRGDVYYVTQRYTAVVNGRRVMRTRQVPKIRWRPASGRTTRHFDDVLVGATQTLPRKITDWLAPWDLHKLVPYTEEYLSGFSSEVYQVDLDEGFNIAQATMDKVIRSDVRQAIGGDQQRISHLRTEHSDTTFKHVLLPLWSAGFQYRGKTYRFVVNGRSGKVRGERPYSVFKIALASMGGLALAAAMLFAMASSQGLSTGGFDVDFGGSSRDWGAPTRTIRWPDVPLGGSGTIVIEVPQVRF